MTNGAHQLKVFLIGLPGSGKTTLAKQVAEQMNLLFFDLDEEIEKAESTKVGEIFSTKGESYFRALETSILKKFQNLNEGFIMATGGGVPCFNDNMILMKTSGVVIFLHVPVDEIASRILQQSVNRPLLHAIAPENLKDKIELLKSHRISFYQQAHHTLSGRQIQPKEIIDLIQKAGG